MLKFVWKGGEVRKMVGLVIFELYKFVKNIFLKYFWFFFCLFGDVMRVYVIFL